MTPLTPLQSLDDAMPKVIGVLSTMTLGLVGVVWKLVDRRVAAVEADMKTKASTEEMTRARDNIGKIFDELRCVREDVNEKHLDVVGKIHTSETRIMAAIQEATLERRTRSRP